jgi:hypothetical protein
MQKGSLSSDLKDIVEDYYRRFQGETYTDDVVNYVLSLREYQRTKRQTIRPTIVKSILSKDLLMASNGSIASFRQGCRGKKVRQ